VLVIPGVGHFGTCSRRLRERGLEDVVRAFVADGRPVLGICVGMQLLYAGSEESDEPGLGLLPGRVVRFPDRAVVPHMGWDVVDVDASGPAARRHRRTTPLLRALLLRGPRRRGHVLARCHYGGEQLPVRRPRGQRVRHAVPPGEVRSGRGAPAVELGPHSSRTEVPMSGARFELYPAVDIRDGGRCG
jgi:hypothetical protein